MRDPLAHLSDAALGLRCLRAALALLAGNPSAAEVWAECWASCTVRGREGLAVLARLVARQQAPVEALKEWKEKAA